MRWWPKWLRSRDGVKTMAPGDFRWRVHAALIRALDGALKRLTGELEQTQRQVADNFEFQNRVVESMQDRIRALELWRQSGRDDGR